MANWKKVVVSGSAADFSTIHVDNLASGVVTGSGSTLGTQAINGTGNILATTGATGISASGSFSGSFYGDGTNLTGVVAAAPNSLHFEGGLVGGDYNGSTAITASISGAASLSSNTVTKWTGTGFANTNITDNGTLVNVLSDTKITGSLDILLTGSSTLQIQGNNFQQTYLSTVGALVLNPGSGGVGMAGVNQYLTLGYIQGQTAGSYLTGSFTGSFKGDGSGLTGVVTSSYANNATSASYANNATSASYASFATNAGNASTADYATNAGNASTANSATSASYASNASTADTAQQINVTSPAITGGNLLYVLNSGSATVYTPIIGTDLYYNDGQKSLTVTSSYAYTASYVAGGNVVGTVSSASYATFAQSAGSATTATTANTASYVAGGNVVGTVASATSASYANNATTASYALNAGAGNGTFSGSFSGSFQGDGSALTGIAATLYVSGGTGNGQVDLKTQTLSIVGTANEVNTSVSGQTVTIGLPDNVTIAATLTAATASIQENLLVQGNTTLQGDLTVNGTTTYINTQNLYVEDKFAMFASGSTTGTDGGIVIQSAAAGTGFAFGYDVSADRWALEDNVSGSATAFSGTPTAYMASVEYGVDSSKPSDGTGPSYGGTTAGYGNIWVSTNTQEIWIYA